MPVSGVPGGPGGYGGDSEAHLLDRLTVLYRYRSVVLAVIIVVLIGGAVQTYTTTPEYKATAVVQIDPERSAVPGLTGILYTGDEDEYQMETEISRLNSHNLARRVALALDLANNPEYNGAEKPPTGLGDAIVAVRTRVLSPIMSLLRGQETPGGTPVRPEEPPAAPTDGLPRETPEESARVAHLMSNRTVERTVGTRLVTITVESRHRQFAADAANMFAKVYVEQNQEARTLALRNKGMQARKTADQKREELQQAKKVLQEAQELAPAGASLDSVAFASIVETARADWDRTALEAANMQARYNNIKNIDLNASNAAEQSPVFSTDQYVINYTQQILDKQKELNTMRTVQGLGAEEPRVKAVQSDLETLISQRRGRLVNIVEQARQQAENAKAVEARALANYQKQQGTANAQAQAGIPISFLKADVDRLQETLNDLEKQAEAASVEEKAIDNNARILDRAQVPGSPFKPDPGRNMLLALVVGIVVALGLAFGLDYLDDTVKTPEDITRKLHVPFLGLVPSVRGEKQPVLSGPVPHDFGESYRALRTSLVFTSGGESTRVITVTSAQPLEGKTTTACNLAMVLAFGGSRVLLVDADMRRPGVHKALKINNTVGLSHLLVGQARVREAIQRTSDPNFCVMTAGRTPPNPSELLSSERMRQLVSNLKQGPFDWVVIDTPPVLAVTDAIILTPLVDGVTFVIGAEMTRRRLAERAVQMVMASRPKVVGAVLNRVNFDRNKYYYSRYYGYQYKSYYGTSTSGNAVATPARD
jgi:capsular exopolysaccharide synthesis family protein